MGHIENLLANTNPSLAENSPTREFTRRFTSNLELPSKLLAVKPRKNERDSPASTLVNRLDLSSFTPYQRVQIFEELGSDFLHIGTKPDTDIIDIPKLDDQASTLFKVFTRDAIAGSFLLYSTAMNELFGIRDDNLANDGSLISLSHILTAGIFEKDMGTPATAEVFEKHVSRLYSIMNGAWGVYKRDEELTASQGHVLVIDGLELIGKKNLRIIPGSSDYAQRVDLNGLTVDVAQYCLATGRDQDAIRVYDLLEDKRMAKAIRRNLLWNPPDEDKQTSPKDKPRNLVPVK